MWLRSRKFAQHTRLAPATDHPASLADSTELPGFVGAGMNRQTIESKADMKKTIHGYDVSTAEGQKDMFYAGRIDPNIKGATEEDRHLFECAKLELEIHGVAEMEAMGKWGYLDRLARYGAIERCLVTRSDGTAEYRYKAPRKMDEATQLFSDLAGAALKENQKNL